MIYLDNGATSFPKVPGMSSVMKECIDRYCGNPGRSGHYMSVKTGEEVYKARKTVAGIFGIRNAERLVFTLNTTASLNMGIRGVLRQGDHAVTTAMEHNSVLRPLKGLESSGVMHTITECAPDGTAAPESIRAAIRENTRLVVCTHASNVTGTMQDIAAVGELIREINEGRSEDNKVYFMVDAAQSAGCVPIDVDAMNIDMLAAPGHKGLLGPLGTGVLYVRSGVDIWPMIQGGTGTESRDRRQPLEFPEGFESGTVNAPGIIGLGYSAAWLEKTGVETIREHEAELVRPLHEALWNMKRVYVYGPHDCSKKTAVVAFNIVDGDGDMGSLSGAAGGVLGASGNAAASVPVPALSCEAAASRLASEYGIAVRSGFHCAGLAHRTIGTWDYGAVRMSLGPFNTKKEIKTAIDAVYKISKSI